MEALTAGAAPVEAGRRSEREILCLLLRTDDGKQLMHEGFDPDDPSKSAVPPVPCSAVLITPDGVRAVCSLQV